MYGFKTNVLVCNRAAANLTIKVTMVLLEYNKGKEDPHLVEPFFINPFNPPTRYSGYLPKPLGKKCDKQ